MIVATILGGMSNTQATAVHPGPPLALLQPMYWTLSL